MIRLITQSRSARWSRHGLTVIGLLLVLFLAGCAVKRVANEEPKTVFTRSTVALMTAPTVEAAEALRRSLLRGRPHPPSAEIIPIAKLEGMQGRLSIVAAGLGECEVSLPIFFAEDTSGEVYRVLQRGGSPGSPCRNEGSRWNLVETYQKIEEKVGEVFIGLLVVGVVALSIALPLILLD